MRLRTSGIYTTFGILIILVLAGFILSSNPDNIEISTKEIANKADLQLSFDALVNKHTNRCAFMGNPQGAIDWINSMDNGELLQGSCCSRMNLHMYAEQVEGLKKYSNITQIPQDPYNVSVKLIKELLTYYQSINLTPEQQSVYDEAMKMSYEGGPCCCKCWRWYAFEGQAKYLIVKHNFNARQITEIWGLEDGCGGEGHGEDHHT